MPRILQNCLIKTASISHSVDHACPHCHCVFLRFNGNKVEVIDLKQGYLGLDSAYVSCSVHTLNPWQNVAWIGRCHRCQTSFLYLEMRSTLALGLMAEKALGYFDHDDADECDPKAYFVVSSPLLGLRWLGLRLLIEGFEAELHRFAPAPLYGLFDSDFWAWKRASLICNWVQRVYQPFQVIPGVRDLSLLSLMEES
jgi:hypothetical protein